MHLLTTTCLLATGLGLSSQVAADPNHWCGNWAGRPNLALVPSGQQLPDDGPGAFDRLFFVEPQLQKVPFSPIHATEPKVQIPKFWGNENFRLALLSYATDFPAPRIYASSKSRWRDFHEGLQGLMTECVSKGSGGAYLVPPSPGLGQATLVVYAYETGSQFDFQMNYFMSKPYGINPAKIQLGQNLTEFGIPAAFAVDYTDPSEQTATA